MSEASAWVAAIAAVFSLIVSVFALNASRSVARLDQKIELSLSRFKEQLTEGKLFADAEVTDLRLKGVDNYLTSLDHRTSRNTDHISMIFNALFKEGILSHLRGENENRGPNV